MGLMESRLRRRCRGGPPSPLAGYPPPQSCTWQCGQPYGVMSELVWRTPPPWLATPPMWWMVGRSACTLTKRTCFAFTHVLVRPPGNHKGQNFKEKESFSHDLVCVFFAWPLLVPCFVLSTPGSCAEISNLQGQSIPERNWAEEFSLAIRPVNSKRIRLWCE